MSRFLYLAEITAYVPALVSPANPTGTTVLRVASGLGYVTGSGAAPANTYYDARIKQPVDISRSMFDTASTRGLSRIGYGDLILDNLDGALDDWIDYGFDGRNVTLYRADLEKTPAPQYSVDFTVAFYGTMELAEFANDVVTIKLRDRQYELKAPLQTTKYAGTNALPNGLEGVATDLKGKPKPICLGAPLNVPALCANTSRLIYQVHDGAVADIVAVYDRGVSLTRGADYVSQVDMETTAPSAANYRVWPAGGYFRLGSSPAGLVTCDPVEGSTAADRTAAQIFSRLLNRAAAANPNTASKGLSLLTTDTGLTLVTDTGVSIQVSSEVSDADLIALDAANSSVLGYWTDAETTVGAVCDLVMGSVGAWWGVDLTGVFRAKVFTTPSGTAVARITPNDLIKPLVRLAVNDPERGIPIYRSTVRWGRIYAVQSTDLAAATSDARRAVVTQEWRESVSTDLTVQASHLFATELVEDSLLTVEANAIAESSRRLTLRKNQYDLFEAIVPMDATFGVVDLGDVVELAHPRYALSLTGTDSGPLFRVLDVVPNAQANTVTLTLWGRTTRPRNLATNGGTLLVTDTGAYLVTAVAA
jgi:hypothetical protein